ADDQIIAIASELPECLLALRIVLDLEVLIVDASFFLEPFGPHIGRLVKALVELSAEVIDHGRFDLVRLGLANKCNRRHRSEPAETHDIRSLSLIKSRTKIRPLSAEDWHAIRRNASSFWHSSKAIKSRLAALFRL